MFSRIRTTRSAQWKLMAAGVLGMSLALAATVAGGTASAQSVPSASSHGDIPLGHGYMGVGYLQDGQSSAPDARQLELDAKGVRVRWVGRRPRLWRSVIREFEVAEEQTKDNDKLTLAMCVNYGGRAEIVDAAREIARLAAAGELRPEQITEKTFPQWLDEPDMPDVDLFLRPSGEKRTSNFLIWQSAYAELVYQDKLFPDFSAQDLFAAVEEYASRDRRFGGTK